MRILEVNTEKSWRGGEKQTLYALKGFRLLGHQVELLCILNSALHKEAKAAGFICHTITSNYSSIFFLLKSGKKYDFIHTQTSKQLTYCILTKAIHRRKVVFSRRVDFVPKGFFTLLKYNACDGIICVSNAIRKILIEAGVNTQIVIISDCIEARPLNIKRANEILNKLTIQNKIIIGTTAALVQHKDPINLVHAIKLLHNMRQDFVLLHFGEGPLNPILSQLIKTNNMETYYKLIGFKYQVEDYFSIFDYFVMSSEEEGLGSSVLDAFIYKIPVISTDAGGLKELVTGRGYVVEKKKSHKLAEALNTALNNTNKNSEWIEKAYNYALTELSIKKIHEKHIDFFNSI